MLKRVEYVMLKKGGVYDAKKGGAHLVFKKQALKALGEIRVFRERC